MDKNLQSLASLGPCIGQCPGREFSEKHPIVGGELAHMPESILIGNVGHFGL
jgi:hypothetical protein